MPDTAPPFPGPVYLIGFMGSGKTTLGRALAAANPALSYIDLDEEVERRAGMSVRDIFARHGERRFRQLESVALRDFASRRNLIVGCGGGTPCQPGNMEFMNANGITVLLRASDAALLRRLTEAQAQRPLLDGMDSDALLAFIRSEQAHREPHYSKARLEFSSDRLESTDEVADSCREFLSLIQRQ